MDKPILVVGSINTDLILRVEHLPVPGETILGGDFQTAGGGKGANQALAAARLGGDVTLVGRIGEDAYGDFHLHGFQQESITTDAISRCNDVPTGTAVILVDDHGQNCIVVSSGANARLLSTDVEHASHHFFAGGILILQLEIPIETVCFAATKAKAAGMQVILNPAPAQKLSHSLLQNTDVLILNETEMEIISGQPIIDEDTLRKTIDTLLESGVQAVILTLGSKGARYFSKQTQFFQPAFQVQAVDTTAAGDAFVGAFAVALSEGKTPTDAMQFAAAAGAFAATKMGAQPSLPKRTELKRFLEEKQNKLRLIES
jgi:ribokinase